ncbi:MAG: hypothetical protein NT027_11420 [Proteobacteria bacterium]|nr:hypothetical protein [Pseudomonadota bacterium]
MAKIVRRITYCVVLCIVCTQELMADIDSSPKVDDTNVNESSAIEAHRQFWDAFSDYEKNKQRASVVEFERAKEGINSQYESVELKALEERAKILDDSIASYEGQLAKNRQASNRPYVLLNLAQVLAEKFSIEKESDFRIAKGKDTRQRALAVLKELVDIHPEFEYLNEANYHRAILLESLGLSVEASKIWISLANAVKQDRFCLHANLAAGDISFSDGDAVSALAFYERANDILRKNIESRKVIDELRIQYRLGWAAFKATNHNKAIVAAKELLNPGLVARAARQKGKIEKDAQELIGFSLFEMDDSSEMRRLLRQPEFTKHLGAIVSIVLKRYAAAGQHQKVIDIGSWYKDQIAGEIAGPEALLTIASSYKHKNQTIQRMDILESLALLLPSNSLWRTKHRNRTIEVQNLDTIGLHAAITVANWYYESGLTSNSPRYFNKAAGFYNILVKFKPNTEDAIGWRIRSANCLLYSGKLQESVEQFEELLTSVTTPLESLSVVMYQKTVALERIWRNTIEKAVSEGFEAKNSSPAIQAKIALEKSVEEHANKFPGQSRSIDLLLVAASANRDMNLFSEAANFWQRALLGQPSDAQRSMAIRGLVFAQLRGGKSYEVITMVSKFLKLESSKTLSQNLKTELEGVLSSAAMDEANQRSKQGQHESAGTLLIGITEEFPNIPNREMLYRDGAYMLALGGKWSLAEDSAGRYLKRGLKKYWGDMTYLMARTSEYQLRFRDAVKAYLELAEAQPNHSRAHIARETAEKLAIADESFADAARSRFLASKATQDKQLKLSNLDLAIEHSLKALDPKSALKFAETRRSLSISETEKIESAINIAMIRHELGEHQDAIDDMDTLAVQIEKNRFKLGDGYQRLAAKVNFFLAEKIKEQMEDIKLSDHSDKSSIVAKKADLFQKLTIRLDKVASLNQKNYSTQARYILGITASQLADEIAGIPVQLGESLTQKSEDRFQQNISRLQELSKRYHSNNILARQRAPEAYAKDDWVRKSALSLSSKNSENLTSTQDQTTAAIQMEAPLQWEY